MATAAAKRMLAKLSCKTGLKILSSQVTEVRGFHFRP